MSDFTSDFWNWWVIVGTVASIGYCAWLLVVSSRIKMKGAAGSGQAGRHHRPHLGRRPRRVQQPAAALVDVAVLDHDRVLGRLSRVLPGPRPRPGRSRVDVGRRGREGERRGRREDQAAVRQVPGDGPEAGGGGSAGARDGRAAVPQQLRAMPRLGRRGQPRLSQPARQRLALGRRAGDDSRIDRERPHGRDAGAGPGARRGRHEERRRLRALAVRPRARRRCAGSSASRCSSRTARRAMASTARATRRWARPT